MNVWDPIMENAALEGMASAEVTILACIILFPLGFAAYRLIAGAVRYVAENSRYELSSEDGEDAPGESAGDEYWHDK